MSALRVLFQALNNESDPYRVSIEPLDIKEAKVYQNTLELTKTKFTSRVYFKLENSSLSFENIKFEDSDETFTLYDKYEKTINTLNVGYYLAIFNGEKCVLVNDEVIIKDDLLKYDILGEVLTEMLSGEDNEIDFTGLVKSINGQLPDLSGNVNIPQPIANSVKIDNSTIKSDADNTIYVDYSEIPFATYTNKGLVKIDSNTMNINNGTISVKNNGTVKSINNQSPDVNGNVTIDVPNLVEIDNDTIKKNNDGKLYVDRTEVRTATYETKGLVKIDPTTLSVLEDGTLTVNPTDAIKTINNQRPNNNGNINLIIPEAVTLDNETIKTNSEGLSYVDTSKLTTASVDNKGIVRVDGTSIVISEQGKISAVRQPRVTSGNLMSTVDAISGDIHLGGGDYKKIYQYNGFMKQWYEIADYSVNTDEFIAKTDIIDELTTEYQDKALSANKGKELSDTIYDHSGQLATKDDYGHVKIGDSLNVVRGLINVKPKLFFMGKITENTTLVTNEVLPFAEVKKSSNGVYDNRTHTLKLSGYGNFRVTIIGRVRLDGAVENKFVRLSLYNTLTKELDNYTGLWMESPTTSSDVYSNVFDTIITTETPFDNHYQIRVSGRNGTPTFISERFSIIVQEL